MLKKVKNEKRKTFAKKVLTFFLRMSTIISTEHESVLITGFVTVRQARPEEKSALITQSFLGCTLFCFGLLFLLHCFYSLKKEPVPRQGSVIDHQRRGEVKRNELPARFDDIQQYCLEQTFTSSLNGKSEKEKNTRPSA